MGTVGTVASDKDRLIELEHHLASLMTNYREYLADARVNEAIAQRLHNAMWENMQFAAARSWESAIYWLIAHDDYETAHKRIKDWAALDFGPALERFISDRHHWLDPDFDHDVTRGDVKRYRAQLAAAQALRAERDRAEAEALAAV